MYVTKIFLSIDKQERHGKQLSKTNIVFNNFVSNTCPHKRVYSLKFKTEII